MKMTEDAKKLEPFKNNMPDPQSSISQPPASDPFDPSNLRLSQSFVETAGVTKLLTTVPERKPGRQDYFRVHPDPGYRENFPIIELKDDQEEYIVVAQLVPELITEIVIKTLFAAINRQGTVFLLPCRLPSPDGKDLQWWWSLRDAAGRATERWVRVVPNMNLGAYELSLGSLEIPDPEWPQLGFWDLIKIAFRDHLIDRMDHPVIRRLRGQI
jgi:hypothetical protein